MRTTPFKEYRSMRNVVVSAFVMIAALTALRACHALREGVNWRGPLGTYAAIRAAMEALP